MGSYKKRDRDGLLGLLPEDTGIEVDYSRTPTQLLVHVLYKYNLSNKGSFWQANWWQADFHLRMRDALQLEEVDEAKLEKFARLLCDGKRPINNDEDAMALRDSVFDA